MKRITPEEVYEAYLKTGLRADTGDINVRKGKTCGLGVLCQLNGISNDDADIRYDWCSKEFGDKYENGFWKGFDGNYCISLYNLYDEEKIGYNDGVKAAAYVREKGLFDDK